MKMNTLDWVAWVLVVVGALNWGLTVFNVNLVTTLFGTGTFSQLLYSLVGLAGLYFVWMAVTKKK